MVALGALLFVIRGFEFNSLHVMWYDSAYGSIIWALLFSTPRMSRPTGSIQSCSGGLMKTRHGEDPRRMVDTDENALYWRFVWLSWLPIYALIYWVPRLFR